MTKLFDDPDYTLLDNEGLSLDEIARTLERAVTLEKDEKGTDYMITVFSWEYRGINFDVSWDQDKKGVYSARAVYRNHLVGLTTEKDDVERLYGLAEERYELDSMVLSQNEAILAARARLNANRRRF